jgi:hypothetical protein
MGDLLDMPESLVDLAQHADGASQWIDVEVRR